MDEMQDALNEMDEQNRLAEEAKGYTRQMAQTLAPLRTSSAFKAFLDLIRIDLEGVKGKRDAVPSESNHAPALFECRALETYMNDLLVRVDTYIKEAQAIDLEESKEKDVEE